MSLAVWLLLTAAEGYPALHAWLHGGTIPDNDDCAVVALVHGKVEASVVYAPMVLPVSGIEIPSRVDSLMVCPSPVLLPDGRGPPVFFAVS